jgi:putative ABC transport system permease protein
VTDFTIIFRSLAARLFSTATTVITVAVAVALMLVLLSMRDAGRKAFERGSGNMHMLVSAEPGSMVSVLNSVFYADAPDRSIPWATYEKIAEHWALDPESGGFAIPLQIGDNYRGLPIVATTPEFFTRFEPVAGHPWRLREGRFFERPWEVVVGAVAARQAGLRVGSHIHLTHGADERGHEHHEFGYDVVGILEPTGSSHDRALFTDLISAWILHAHDRREREGLVEAAHHHGEHEAHSHDNPGTTEADLLPSDRKITGIYLRAATRPGAAGSAAIGPLFAELRAQSGLTVADPVAEIGNLFAIVSNIDQILIGMAAVVLVSSGIAIMLALYNSMEQRRRQIAVFRVLGCSRGRIFNLVLTESAIIGLLGAAVGVLLSVAGSWAVAAALRQRVGLVIEPRLGLDWTLYVVAGTVVLAAAAGIVPAVMAYRTSVANNLRPLG